MRGSDVWALVLLAAAVLVSWIGGRRHDVD